MTSAQVVETSVTNTISLSQDCTTPDDHTSSTSITPGIRPFTLNNNNNNQQTIPTAVMENAKAKILWDTPFQLEKAPENGANKIDIAVLDKENNLWLLMEGTVCQVGKIEEKTSLKQEKYNDLRKGIKNLYKGCKVTQINIVFDFLGGYHIKLEKELHHIIGNKKQTDYLIKKCQKWLVSQNNEIVKSFYVYTH